MKLIEQLKQFESLAPIGSRRWIYHNRTSKFLFTNFICESASPDRLFQVAIRGNFSKAAADALLDSLDQGRNLANVCRPLVMYPASTGPFTNVCAINSECHDTFLTFTKELHERTIVIFPIYRCEFSGDESPELIRLMRKDFVSTVDWQRSTAPKILMRYENYAADLGSADGKLGLARLDDLYNIVNELDRRRGFIEIENYQHEVVTIEASEDGFSLSIHPDHEKKTKKQLLLWIQSFIF